MRRLWLLTLTLTLLPACSPEGATVINTPPADTGPADLRSDAGPGDVPREDRFPGELPRTVDLLDAAQPDLAPDLPTEVAPDLGPPPCQSDEECDDGLPCTPDLCVDGLCVHDAPPGLCCTGHADCDDQVSCTDDKCVGGFCKHYKDDNFCCGTDADCAQPDPCESGVCVNEECTFPPVPGCCYADHECADGQAETVDLCAGHACIHSLADPPTSCETDADCPVPNECVETSCLGNLCTHAPADKPGCCGGPADCDDGQPCTADTCTAFHCGHSPVAGFVPHVEWDFDNGSLEGFKITGGSGAVTWQLSDAMAISAPWSLYFGDPGGPTLNNGKTVAGTVTTPPATLADAGPHLLRAWTFIDCEPLFSRDVVSIRVQHGAEETEVWTKEDIGGTTGLTWKEIEIDLTPLDLGGETIQLVFSFDSIDSLNNDYQGIYFDDIRVLWPCAP